ncbi:MAG: PD-(D/E)XK nuclease family protein [Acidobacteriota bacterium]
MKHMAHVSGRLGLLEEALLQALVDAKKKDPFKPLTVLVGSRLVGLYLQRALALRGNSHLNIDWPTPPELARRIAGPCGETLSPVAEAFLVRKLKARGYFDPVAERRGFYRVLHATLKDLRDGGFRSCPVPSGDSNGKIREVAQLHKRYLAALEGFVDDAGVLDRAAASSVSFDRLWIYGLYDFTEMQRRLIEAIARQVPVECFFLEHEFSKPTLEWFESIGFEKSVEKSRRLVEKSRRLEACATATCVVLSASTEVREVTEIAREIYKMCRDENYHFHEIGVALRNSEEYSALFQQVFENLGIPAFVQKGNNLAAHSLGRAVLLLVDLAQSEYRREAVVEWVKFAEVQQAALWDRLSLEAGVTEGKENWRRKLKSLKGAYYRRRRRLRAERGILDESTPDPPDVALPAGEQALLDRIKAIDEFVSFLSRLFQHLESLPPVASWSRFSKLADQLVQYFHPRDPDLERVSEALASLAQIERLEAETTFATFREMVHEAFEQVSWHSGAFQRNAVSVFALMAGRGVRFRALFVPGMVEKSFPAQVRQDPILLDEERKQINTFGQGRLPLKLSRLDEEALLFDLIQDSATERVLFSYPRMDAATGRDRVPSPFLLKLHSPPLETYDALSRLPGFRRVGTSEVAPQRAADSLRRQEYDLYCIQRSTGEERKDLGRYLMRADPWLRRSLVAHETRFFSGTFTPFDGIVSSRLSRGRLAARFDPESHTFSATQLETYATCPYRFFLRDVLRLDPQRTEETIQGLTALDRGSLAHEILRDFFSRVSPPLDPDQKQELSDKLNRTIEQHFARAEAEGITGYRLLWEMDRQRLREDLLELLDRELAESRWIPAEFEVWFDTIVVDSPVGPVRFKGKVDRIDRSGGYTGQGAAPQAVRVIDYKTGKVYQKVKAPFGGGRSLQLPIYMLAAQQRYGLSDMERSIAEYYFISRRQKFKKIEFPGRDWPRQSASLSHVAGTLVAGILQGQFFPFPGHDAENCKFCDFRSVCDRRVVTLFDKKRDDPVAENFLGLKKEPE